MDVHHTSCLPQPPTENGIVSVPILEVGNRKGMQYKNIAPINSLFVATSVEVSWIWLPAIVELNLDFNQ